MADGLASTAQSTDPNTGKVLMLSTRHIPLDDLEGLYFAPCRWSETEYGWVAWPLDPATSPELFSDWFRPINKWAYEQGYQIIEFDRDNNLHPELPWFDTTS